MQHERLENSHIDLLWFVIESEYSRPTDRQMFNMTEV